MRELVAKWTGEYQLTFDVVLEDMIQRCRELNLRAVGPERKLLLEFTVLLTAKTMHALLGPSRRNGSRYEVDRVMKPLRILVLTHPDLIPPESSKGYSEAEINVWKTEYDVVTTLRGAGHEVRPLGVHDELKPIREQIDSFKPDVVFTLLEQFHGEAIYDQNVVSYLELMHMPYTGCNPRGLMLARGKDLSKTLVHYHRIPVPDFAVFPMHRKVKRPSRLGAAAHRQERQRGCLLRHLAGFRRRHRREARRARHFHSRAASARPPSPSNISKAAKSMSALSATSGC